VTRVYLDSSAFVALYVLEPGTSWVQKHASRASVLLLNSLQVTETKNAVLAATGRGLLPPEAVTESLRNFENDIASGVYALEETDWPAAWKRANQLAVHHTPRLLCRTLDILHVALAELSDSTRLVTGDLRQQKLCKAIRLPCSLMPNA